MRSFLQHHDSTTLATGHSNLVILVELLFLIEKLSFFFNDAVQAGVLDLCPSSGKFLLLEYFF